MARSSKKRRPVKRGIGLPRNPEHSQKLKGSLDSDRSIQKVADNVPAAIFIFKGNKNCLVNPAAEVLTGYSRKELLKMEFWEMLHPEFKGLVKERGLQRQKGAHVPSRYEVKIIRKDGEERWLDYTGRTIKFQGEMAVMGTAIDITEKKQAEEQDRHNLTRIEALHDAILAATSTLDLKTVLQSLLGSIDRFFSCAVMGAVRILSLRDGLPEVRAVINVTEQEWVTAILHDRTGLGKAVLENKEPVVIVDALQDPRTRYVQFFHAHGLVSFLGIPLIAKGNVVGDLSIFTKGRHPFSDQEINFVSSLAAQAATAIHNSLLYEEMERKTKEVSTLNTLTAATTQSLDPNSVVQEAVKSIVEVFNFEGARIYLFNELPDEAHLRASFEVPRGWISPVEVVRAGEGVVGTVLKTAEMIVLEDIQSDPRYKQLSKRHAAQKAGARLFAAFPIQSKLKLWGVLACMGKDRRHLRTEEVVLLVTLCNQVAISVENTTLFQQTAQKAKELSALYSIAATATALVNLNALLYQSMRKVLDIFGFTAARIHILDNEKKEIRLAAQEGFPANFTFPMSLRRGEGLIGQVVDTGLPLTFEDVQTNPEYHRLARSKRMSKAGFRAMFFIPLRVRGETLGVMTLVSKDPYAFSSSDLQLIKSIAYHLGIAIGNAHIFSQLKEKTLHLEKANKAKDEFLSIVSHELRTPLNVILGYTELMQDGTVGNVSHELRDIASKVKTQTQNLLTVIENILVTTGIEAGAMRMDAREVDVASFFAELKLLYELPRRDDLQLVWDIPSNLPPLTTDGRKLKHIMQNLIDNAIKFTEEGEVMVSARYVSKTATFNFSVQDSGIGIRLDDMPAIFKMFHQVDSSETRTYGGVGLGLYIANKFADLLGGTIKVESEIGKGSTFTFAIPLVA